MQKKLFPIFSILLLLISLVAPGIQPVAAEETEKSEYKEGTYSIPIKILDANEDKNSAMHGFLENEVVPVTITNGKAMITTTFTGADMIKRFEVNGTEANVVSEDKEVDKRTYSFEIDNLDEIAKGKVAVEVPGVYDTTHNIRIQIDTTKLPVIEEETEEEETEEEETEEEEPEVPDDSDGAEEDNGESDNEDESDKNDSNDDSSDDSSQDGDDKESEKEESDQEQSTEKESYEDGKYTLDFTVDVPRMEGHMEQPAKVEIHKGNNEITLRFNSQKLISNFEIEKDGQFVEAKRQKIDDEYVDYTFTVDNLGEKLSSRITIDTGNPQLGEMKHEFNITFDTESLEELTEENPEEDLADGTYKIDYDLLQEEKDETSTAAGYVVNPAYLAVEKGVKTVYFTLTDNEAIKDFKLESDGKLQSAKIIETNEKNNTRLVAAEVEDLDVTIKGQFKVFIPSINYEAEPYVRLQFNIDSIEQTDDELPSESESTKPESLEEGGAYTMNMRVLTEEGFEKSPIGSYIKMPIDLTVNKDKNVALLTLLNSNKVKDFKVKKEENPASSPLITLSNLSKVTQGDYQSVPVIKVDEKNDKRIIALEVDDLDGQVEALVSIENDGEVTDHSVRLFFEENSIRESEGLPVEDLDEVETPVKPDPEYTEEYDLDYTFFEKGKDNKSSMDGFKKGPAKIKEDKDGNYYVTMEFTSGNMIEYIKINDVEADVVKEYKEDDVDIKVFEIELKDLTKNYDVKVFVNAGIYSTEHEVDLVFGKELEEEPEPDYTEEYDLDYTFFEKDKDNKSSMDGFKKGPAKVKEDKDGNYLVTMEFTSGNMIEYIKVNDVEADVVKEYKEDDVDIKVFEIELKDLTKNYDVKVFVNAGIYSTEHEVDLVFGEEPEPEGTSKKAASGDPTPVNGNDTLNVETSNVSKGSQVSIKMPANLPEDTEMTVEVLEKDSSVPKEYKIAGAIIDVTVVSKEELKDGKYTLTLPYNKDKFKANEVGIYYYDADNKSWVFQEGGKVDSNAGTITLEVDGFSKYGVLAEAEKEEPEPEPNQEYIKEYDLGYTFYEKGKGNKSSMDGFKKGPAKVKEDKDGNYLVTMEFTSGEMIEYLKINDVDAKVVKEYKEKDVNIKAFEVKLKDLTKKHDVKVFVDAGIYSKEHAVDLVFDEIGTPPKPEPKPTPKPSVEPTKGDKGDGKGKGKSKKDKVENYNFFTIDYNFYKPGTTETSVMQDFTEKGPALIRENKKNGNYNVTMTFTNGDMIKEFEVNGNSATVIKNEKGNKTFDFVVKDLDEIQKVKAEVDVPGLYSETYEVDLVFDLGSKKKLDEKDVPGWLKEYIESLTVGQSGSGGSGTTPDPVPDFDRDADGNIIGSNGDSGSGINPKTADLNMTQIMLFGSLLLLSLIPLVIKLRRRFVMEE